jgi:hypothetical protein
MLVLLALDDDVFTADDNSLSAMYIINDSFGMSLGAAAMFELNTIERQAAHIRLPRSE